MYSSSNNNNSLTLGTRTTFTTSEWFAYRRSPTLLRLPDRRLAPPRLHSVGPSSSQPLDSSTYTSTVGSPPPPPLISPSSFTRSHLLLLNVIACSVAVSATWLFCSAIPALLAFKRAAESMEKLLDVTREELPGTMAAVRLSGMEISDLTMELSDLGQQLTQGVRGSTRAVRLAEERLRQFTNTSPSGGSYTGNKDTRADRS